MAGEKSRGVEELEQEAKSIGDMTAKLSIDASDALTGLKAVQREARRTTRSLRELEEQQKKNMSLPWSVTRSDLEFKESFEKVKEAVGEYCTGCNRHEQYCVCSDSNE